jgi:hypothetical protein
MSTSLDKAESIHDTNSQLSSQLVFKRPTRPKRKPAVSTSSYSGEEKPHKQPVNNRLQCLCDEQIAFDQDLHLSCLSGFTLLTDQGKWGPDEENDPSSMECTDCKGGGSENLRKQHGQERAVVISPRFQKLEKTSGPHTKFLVTVSSQEGMAPAYVPY